jgi:hypothetical protein
MCTTFCRKPNRLCSMRMRTKKDNSRTLTVFDESDGAHPRVSHFKVFSDFQLGLLGLGVKGLEKNFTNFDIFKLISY